VTVVVAVVLRVCPGDLDSLDDAVVLRVGPEDLDSVGDAVVLFESRVLAEEVLVV
jgi:hypothetical protein